MAASAPLVHKFLVKRQIDDAVGAFAVHGFAGFAGLTLSGIFLSGYPNMGEGVPPVNFLGQFGGAVVLGLLGFIPGYLISLAMKKMGVLRVPAHAEERGLDLTEVPAQAYPEWALTGASTTYVSTDSASATLVVAEVKTV